MDPNAFTTPFQLTKSMHRDIYPAIDPKTAALSAKGKTILITGAGGGLGGVSIREIARAWAEAGAKGIILTGRNASLLEEPEAAIKSISPDTRVLVLGGTNLSSESEVKTLFDRSVAEFGKIDAVAHSAASVGLGTIGDLEPDAWFQDFEVNVKGTYLLAHHFLRVGKGEGTFFIVTSLAAGLLNPGMSSYSISKLAMIRLAEYLTLEKPSLRVFTIHPGCVEVTASGRGSTIPDLVSLALDKGLMTGGVMLYLMQSKADYLKGTYLSVNWDLEEIEAHKQEIVDKNLTKIAFLGAKLGPEGHPWE